MDQNFEFIAELVGLGSEKALAQMKQAIFPTIQLCGRCYLSSTSSAWLLAQVWLYGRTSLIDFSVLFLMLFHLPG